jgi:hypothetical protein
MFTPTPREATEEGITPVSQLAGVDGSRDYHAVGGVTKSILNDYSYGRYGRFRTKAEAERRRAADEELVMRIGRAEAVAAATAAAAASATTGGNTAMLRPQTAGHSRRRSRRSSDPGSNAARSGRDRPSTAAASRRRRSFDVVSLTAARIGRRRSTVVEKRFSPADNKLKEISVIDFSSLGVGKSDRLKRQETAFMPSLQHRQFIRGAQRAQYVDDGGGRRSGRRNTDPEQLSSSNARPMGVEDSNANTPGHGLRHNSDNMPLLGACKMVPPIKPHQLGAFDLDQEGDEETKDKTSASTTVVSGRRASLNY